MGYEIPAKHARIRWDDDTEFAGLEAVLSLDTPADLLFQMQGFEDATPEGRRELMVAFGDSVLVEWNLEAKGRPVPASGEGMLTQPMRLVSAIMSKWTETVAAEGPLEQPSSVTTGLAELSRTANY